MGQQNGVGAGEALSLKLKGSSPRPLNADIRVERDRRCCPCSPVAKDPQTRWRSPCPGMAPHTPAENRSGRAEFGYAHKENPTAAQTDVLSAGAVTQWMPGQLAVHQRLATKRKQKRRDGWPSLGRENHFPRTTILTGTAHLGAVRLRVPKIAG